MKNFLKLVSKEGKAAEPSHAGQPTSSVQTELETLPAAQVAPAVQPSTAGTPQVSTPVPSVHITEVVRMLQNLTPGLNLAETLSRIATQIQPSPIVQNPLFSTPLPPSQNPSLAETSLVLTAEPPKAISHTSERSKTTTKRTTSTSTSETSNTIAQPTPKLTDNLPQTEPIQILGDVAKMGVNLTPEAAGEESRVEELVEVTATLRAGGSEMTEAEGKEAGEDKMTETEAEEIRGERIVESEAVVDEGEKAEEASDDGSEEDEGSTEKSGEESAEVDNTIEGTEILESEEESWNLSGGTQEIREEEGEVVNRIKEKKCKSVMRKFNPEMERVGQETRRFSRRIAGKESLKKAGYDEEKEMDTPVEISSEEEEEEVPLKRRSRSIPTDQAAAAAEETMVPSPGTPTEPVTLATAESISTPATTKIQATPVPEQMPEEAE